jgi:hypothetical protein
MMQSITLPNAVVKVTLVGSSNFSTSTHLVASGTQTVRADVSGNWSATITGTDSLSAPGGQTATYTVEYEHTILTDSGQKIMYQNLTVPANGATTTLLSVVRAQ